MTTAPPALVPDDAFNRRLIGHVHPPGWRNPKPADRYNLVVVGAGTAGLVTAAASAGLGARVALVERHLMGGDCLNVGCVPSKGIIRAARAWAAARNGDEFGLRLPGGIEGDFSAVMARMRQIRADLAPIDSVERFAGLGVDVFLGEARFTGPDRLAVGDATLRFARAAICTGARAAAPPIPGLAEAGCLTNETVFSLTELPRRLGVIGAGPIGCELAQAFARFGSEVTLLEIAPHILPREDPDAAEVVQAQMMRDGVRFAGDAAIEAVEAVPAAGAAGDGVGAGGRERRIRYTQDGSPHEVTVDEILVGSGRTPNVEGLDLEAAGVAYDRAGVTVDRHLRTTNPRIYAAGDICFPFKFTHTADAMAQIVVQNALFPHPLGLGRASTEGLIIPWCTYTEPEIAHVGMYEADARTRGIAVETFTQPLADVDRAVLDGEEAGFARVHVRKGTDRILGATIVAADAGNLISEVTVAMKAGAGLGTIGAAIHPYPTQAEALRKAATQLRKARFSARQRSVLQRWFAWTR
ncbi:MAG: mercuric reductase [Acidobacteria bacterium]|nr:mercuric reductase [Acidobacteriota bacterium]